MRCASGAAVLLIAACSRAPAPAAPDPPFKLTPISEGLAAPLALRDPGDGSGRLFVVEQGGTIRVLKNGAGPAPAKPFLRIAGEGGRAPPLGFTSAGAEQGLLGLAFHPHFASNRTFYIDYTDADGDIVVARYVASSRDAALADADSGSVVLHVPKDFANHNGGAIEFGPDGYLYVAIGDGGGGGHPCARAQTVAPVDLRDDGPCAPHERFLADGGNPHARALQGKLLRIDVDRKSAAGTAGLCAARADGSAAYAAPDDNPFALASGRAGCAEIWAYGLRNPWRFSFDRASGDLFIGDVGQDRIEEIDHAPHGAGGRDYGWSVCEGPAAFGADGECPVADTARTPRPILAYTHATGGCSVTGGYRYRGPVATLAGAYVFGDNCSGKIWLGRQDAGGRWHPELALASDHHVTSFGEDAAGNVYVVDGGAPGAASGKVLRIDPP